MERIIIADHDESFKIQPLETSGYDREIL